MCSNDIQVLCKRSEQTDPHFVSTGALSMLFPTPNKQHQSHWVWKWCLQGTRVLGFLSLPSPIAWTATSNLAFKMGTSSLCQAAEGSDSCDLLVLSGDPLGGQSSGILGPSHSSPCSSAPTRAGCDSSFRGPVLGQKKTCGGSVTSQLRLMRACPCLSVPLCYVTDDGTQNKCPVPAQLEMTVSRSSTQGFS